MTDHEIHKCIDEKNEKLIGHITNIIDGYTKTTLTLITEENQNVRKSIDGLTERVGRQNGRIGKSEDRLKEAENWIGKRTGELASGKLTWVRIFNVLMALIGATALVFTAIKVNESKKLSDRTEQKVDNLGVPFITNSRGDPMMFNDTTRIYYWPADSAYLFIIQKVKNEDNNLPNVQ